MFAVKHVSEQHLVPRQGFPGEKEFMRNKKKIFVEHFLEFTKRLEMIQQGG